MAVSVTSSSFKSSFLANMASGTGASFPMGATWDDTLVDSGSAIFDRVFALQDYTLTVAASPLSIDLYDLGTLDLGAGAGLDNLGLTHANARIIAMGIRNQEVTGNGTLQIDQVGATTTAWAGFGHADLDDTMALGEFRSFYWGPLGRTVTDTTDHILRLNAVTNSCKIDVVFVSKQS